MPKMKTKSSAKKVFAFGSWWQLPSARQARQASRPRRPPGTSVTRVELLLPSGETNMGHMAQNAAGMYWP